MNAIDVDENTGAKIVLDGACVSACPTQAIEYKPVDPGAWLVGFGEQVNQAYRKAVEGESRAFTVGLAWCCG